MASVNKFNRFYKLTIDDKEIDQYRITFRVERLFGESLHSLELTIYNADKLFKIEKSGAIGENSLITLDAGYENVHDVIFDGIIKNIEIVKNGTELETQLYCYDSRHVKSPVLSFTLTNSNSLYDVIEHLAFAADIDIAQMNIDNSNMLGSFVAGKSFREHMNDLAKSFNFNWQIIQGKLYLHKNLKGSGRHFNISVETGMLDAPVLTDQGINVKLLMEAGMKPNDSFTINSRWIRLAQAGLQFQEVRERQFGENIVKSLTHTGDTHGDTWMTEIIGLVK